MTDNALHGENWRTCFALLPKVSRTFALSIALLKPPMRHAVCLGYLLCRLVDTFEDAETLSTPQKAAFIRDLQTFLSGQTQPAPDWVREAVVALGAGVSPSDKELLLNLDAVLAAYESLPEHDRQSVDRCVQEMAIGMIEMQALLDQRGAEASPSDGTGVNGSAPAGAEALGARRLRLLPTMESLTRYCHYVAGIVGTLLTELLFLNSEAVTKGRYFDLLQRSETFGQYLQKINILKDIPGDHAKGWCFIPQAAVQAAGLTPEGLLSGDGARRVGAIAPVMRDVLNHLALAWQYVTLVPLKEREYRLFLGYSFFFGVATVVLGLKEPDRSFEGDRPLKIGRLDVAAIIARVNAAIDDPQALRAYLHGWLQDARAGLDPRWPAGVAEALNGLLRTLEPAVAAR